MVPSKPPPPIPDTSNFTYEPITRLKGYFSPKRADYFIWEFGSFNEGAKVILGDDLRLAKITRVEGVGRNFIKFGVEAIGSSSKNEIPVRRIIISFSPNNFNLTRFQRLKIFFFRRFLKSMRDIVDENRDWDDSEMMVQRDVNADYGKMLYEMFGFMIRE